MKNTYNKAGNANNRQDSANANNHQKAENANNHQNSGNANNRQDSANVNNQQDLANTNNQQEPMNANNRQESMNTNNRHEPMNAELIKMPKNIRQIGNIGSHNKVIYVEDYVMTFIKQLSGKDYSACRIAILLGYYIRTEGSKNLFIKGAVEMKNTEFINEIGFSDEGWSSVYENIKKYFTDVEIVGWSLIGPEFFLESGEKTCKLHIDNFVGADKTLLKMDSMEKEEAFYLYENNQLVKQTGYYIYYEKNEEMQNYMLENKETPSEEKNYIDQTTRKIRSVIQEKKDPKKEKNAINLLYVASTLLAVIVLVISAALLKNYDKLRSMETAINAISDNMNEKKNDDSVEDSLLAEENSTEEEQAEVVTKPQTSDDSSSDAAIVDKQSTVEEPETIEVETVSANIPLGEDADTVEINTDTVDETVDNTKNEEPESIEPENETETSKEETASTELEKEVASTEPEKEVVSEPEKTATETVAEVKYYKVKAGESLAGISYKLYNSANYINVIKKLNGIEDENKIYEGQKLIIP